MSADASFALQPLQDGRHRFRALDEDSGRAIDLLLDEQDRRALGIALADALTQLDAPGVQPEAVAVVVGGQRVRILPSHARGLRFSLQA